MSNTKTEAQRLADDLTFTGRYGYETEDQAQARRLKRNVAASNELRRLIAENDTLHKTIDSLTAQLRDYAGLKAARVAYASEFCFDKDGEPDVGSIHQNIRLLKAERDQLRAQLATAAAEEREACAKVCERIDLEYEGEDVQATWCSAAIRARSNNAPTGEHHDN